MYGIYRLCKRLKLKQQGSFDVNLNVSTDNLHSYTHMHKIHIHMYVDGTDILDMDMTHIHTHTCAGTGGLCWIGTGPDPLLHLQHLHCLCPTENWVGQ